MVTSPFAISLLLFLTTVVGVAVVAVVVTGLLPTGGVVIKLTSATVETTAACCA